MLFSCLFIYFSNLILIYSISLSSYFPIPIATFLILPILPPLTIFYIENIRHSYRALFKTQRDVIIFHNSFQN